jgi:tetratricopeptide (TPR) repeat protein
MKILNDCINALKKITTTRKKSLINRSFIVSISIIYSVLILAAAASFQYSMNAGSAILFDALKSYNEDLMGGRIGMLVERLREKGATSREDMRNEIENFNFGGDILFAVFFTKTDDENYFRILHAIPLRSGFDLNLAENATVRENKKINYLRKGLLHGILDPGIYSKDGYRWQNIYYPYQIKNRKAVLQFLVSASRTEEAVKNYHDSIKNIRIFNIFMTVFLVLAVVVISGVFVQNYSLLIKNLSSRMNKAASGDLDVSLNQTSDSDLNLLALSFNTLVEELKEKTDRRGDVEGLGTLFSTGVAILKENRLDDAAAVFKTLTLIKPQGFSSYFNLGVAYAKKLDYANALAAFEQALKINPTHELTMTYINKIKEARD